MVWLGCLAVGLLLVIAYQQSHRSAPAREVARQELISRIRSLQAGGNRPDDAAKSLAAEVASLRDAQLSGRSSAQLRELEVAAGSVAVTGPGVVVQAGEPPAPQASAGNARPGTTAQNQVAVLHDRDLRAVVNELWAAGAEAITVNGIRLGTTSVIRFAGEAILVDQQPINSPYEIQAVGPRDQMLVGFADSQIARKLKTLETVDGVAFKFSGKSDLRLDSVTVSRPRFASGSPPGSAAPTGQPASTTPAGSSPAGSSPAPTGTESPR